MTSLNLTTAYAASANTLLTSYFTGRLTTAASGLTSFLKPHACLKYSSSSLSGRLVPIPATSTELKEKSLWDGIPHETVMNYGLTKKMMALQGWAYKKQYGFNSIHLILTNLYGPRDSYNPERLHVVAALIRKWVEAKMAGAAELEVWGTGRPIREFLYVASLRGRENSSAHGVCSSGGISFRVF